MDGEHAASAGASTAGVDAASAGGSTSAGDPLLLLIVSQPGMAGRLLAQHVDDGSGRCRACTLPEKGGQPWPCTTHHYAIRASEVQRCGGPDRARWGPP